MGERNLEPTREQYQRILDSAIRAPSADNHHRFQIEIADRALRLWFPASQMPPSGGYKRALMLLSLGAVSENITLEAEALGLHAECALFPDPFHQDLAVEVGWSQGAQSANSLFRAIPDRHTNRRLLYHGPKLASGELEILGAAAEGFLKSSLFWLDEPGRRRKALRLVRLAETERFRNRVLHEELFSAIRFDVGWTATCEEGLPPGALEVEGPLRPMFKLMRHWRVMRTLNLLGTHYVMGVRAAWLPCRFAPHLGLVAVKGDDEGAVFAAGRMFQRVWLAATELGLSLQPFPASAIYSMAGAVAEHVPGDLQRVLAEGWRQLMPPDSVPVMLFRVGRAGAPTLTTSRRTVDSYTKISMFGKAL